MQVRLWSPKGDCHVALTTGHTWIVSGAKEGTELPTIHAAKFQKRAVELGCLPVGMEPIEDAMPSTDRDTIITEKMKAMLVSDDPSYFTADSLPNMNVLSNMCGFKVDRQERDRLWKAIENDPDGLGDKTETV